MQASAKCATAAPRANVRTGDGDSRSPRQLSAIRRPTQLRGAGRRRARPTRTRKGEAPVTKERPQ
eukprot:15292900-Alexandrium_andersonii.AAC.1